MNPTTLPKIEPVLLEAGDYPLRYGLTLEVRDPVDDKPLVPLVDRTLKCPLTRFSAWSCQCWQHRGLAKNPTA